MFSRSLVGRAPASGTDSPSSSASHLHFVFQATSPVLIPRRCRMKALLFMLVRAFEFELAVPKEDIQSKTGLVQRPQLRSAPEQGSQMPLLVRKYTRAS